MALCVSTPKSTILLIVDATELLICVIINTPKKLNTALIIIAFRGLKHRVVTQVAIAFGASVQPFTKITPNVNNTVISNIWFSKIPPQKFKNDTSIKAPFVFSHTLQSEYSKFNSTTSSIIAFICFSDTQTHHFLPSFFCSVTNSHEKQGNRNETK